MGICCANYVDQLDNMDRNMLSVNGQLGVRDDALNDPFSDITNIFSQGIELATAVEEAVSSVTQESADSTLSQQQAWKSVVLLATNKLRSLEKQQKQREYLTCFIEQNARQNSHSADNDISAVSNHDGYHIQSGDREIGFPNMLPAASFREASLMPSLTREIQHPPLEDLAALPSNPSSKPAMEQHMGEDEEPGLFSWAPSSFGSLDTASYLEWGNDIPEGRLFGDVTGIDSNLDYPAQFRSTKYVLQPNHGRTGHQPVPAARNPPQKTVMASRSTSSRNFNRHITKAKKRSKGTSAEQIVLGSDQSVDVLVSNDPTQHPGLFYAGAIAVNVLPRGRPSERGETCAYCMLHHKKARSTQYYAWEASPAMAVLSLGYIAACVYPQTSKGLEEFYAKALYHTRIKTLLDNISGWLPTRAFDPPTRVRIGNGFHASFEIDLKAYLPNNADLLTHVLFRGLQGGMIAPKAQSSAFALKENTLSTKKIDEYCDRLVRELIQKEATEQYSFANHILLFALNQSEVMDEREKLPGIDIVKLSLRFWAIQAVFFKAPWDMVDGADRVGMAPLNIPGFWHNRTLLPRLVNQELDRAFEKRMDEIEKDILERLQQAVFQEHRSMWCSIFLTSFILLHSLEKDSWNMHAWEYEKNRPGGTPWPLNVTPAEYYMQNQHISEMIAVHLRVVNKSHTAFSLDLTKKSNQQLLQHPAAKQLTITLQQEMREPKSRFRQQLGGVKNFNREDVESLNYLYTKALVLD